MAGHLVNQAVMPRCDGAVSSMTATASRQPQDEQYLLESDQPGAHNSRLRKTSAFMQKPVENPAPVARIRSSPSAIKAEVQRLLPAIKAAAAETERARRVPDAHVEALREIGFFKLVQPAAFGGDEHDFVVLAELIMEIAQACA